MIRYFKDFMKVVLHLTSSNVIIYHIRVNSKFEFIYFEGQDFVVNYSD